MNEIDIHPKGEAKNGAVVPVSGPEVVDTFAGRIHVEWDPRAAVTPLVPAAVLYRVSQGQLAVRSLGGGVSA